MTKFQERLHNLRIEHGYSLESLANELNNRFNASFNKGMLSKYESGKTVPDFKNVPCIAEFFGVSVDYLIGISDNPNLVPVLDPQEQQLIPQLKKQYSPADIEKAMMLYERYKDSIPEIQNAVEGLLKSHQSDP
jgi:transcriptional regulator with XRE-family HTH domain